MKDAVIAQISGLVPSSSSVGRPSTPMCWPPSSSPSGVLVADAEHRHNAVFEDGTVIKGGCNAHGRRTLRDAKQVQPVLAADGGRFITAVFEAEAKALGLEGDALREWRQRTCGPHFDAFGAWSNAVKPTVLPSDPLAKVLNYYDNHWEALTCCLARPEVPIDDSGTERLYRPVAKLRHIVFFAGSTEGAHRLAPLLGMVPRAEALASTARRIWRGSSRGWARTATGTTCGQPSCRGRPTPPRWRAAHP